MADREPCRLYLVTPPELVSGGVLLRDFLPLFESALKAADVACLLIAAPLDTRDVDVEAVAQPLIQAAQAREVAALLSSRAALAKTLGADGVHLDLRLASAADATRTYREARKTLAEDAIVGALCPPERHLAMELAELGADYIGFDLSAPEAADLIAWWGEMMTVPSIAFGRIDPAAAAALARSGADFIAPEPEVWSRVDPAGELAKLQAAIRAG
ncbi:thiamine phosphate synthase [Dongia sedimenti]|uniref:Thiamine phosphate synthase n=1 Tax=Dongia sedimenti TaxID=3064282 RepID=A0ABU0YFI9_9PROT|nr:thiamine phosphate synthase [Rhodospirillaceae bacterium R-7]